jgi:hypothetical protein
MPVCISSNPMAWYLMMSSGMFKPNDVVGKTLYCVMLFVSMMFMADSNCTRATICCVLVVAPVVVVVLLFALVVGAGADVAELAGAGTSEPSELVWDALVELEVTDTVAVLVAAAAGEDTTLAGFSGLTGLTGLITFVGFVTLLTHVFEVVVQTPGQIGEPYGSGHVEVCDCMMYPV